jgi:hypothetical protein
LVNTGAGPAVLLDAVLARLLARHGGRQIFVFGAEGTPFWAARVPVDPREVGSLDLAPHAPVMREEIRRCASS